MMIHACTRTLEARQWQKCAQLFISIRMDDFGTYVCVCAWIIMKINVLIYRYTKSLNFKFYEDPLISCREIAETKLSINYSNF